VADNAGDLVYNAEKPLTDFHKVPTYQNVHTARRMKMLAKYPQIKELYTPDPWVAVVTGSIVASQMLMCYCMSDKQVWFILLCSYLFGSFANQALFLCIHDLSHNTAFGHRWKLPNNFMSMIANTPAVVPMSVSFRKYHLDHHTSMNVEVEDVDVPTDLEGRLIGGNWFLKLTWTTLQIVWYAIRPVLTNPKPLTWDDVVNWLYILAVDYGVLAGWGWRSFLYLVFCSFVGGGLHPMAGHFIAEHYVFAKGQETYSYYGILNFFGMNAGYHVEHHDFPRIPGTKLPFVHQIAPEFYQVRGSSSHLILFSPPDHLWGLYEPPHPVVRKSYPPPAAAAAAPPPRPNLFSCPPPPRPPPPGLVLPHELGLGAVHVPHVPGDGAFQPPQAEAAGAGAVHPPQRLQHRCRPRR
jgi:sphingolipid 4-desaturase/C4-monooxygenase